MLNANFGIRDPIRGEPARSLDRVKKKFVVEVRAIEGCIQDVRIVIGF